MFQNKAQAFNFVELTSDYAQETNSKNSLKYMFFCLCASTTLDVNQAKAQLLIKNVKLFAHTEKTYYLCTRK